MINLTFLDIKNNKECRKKVIKLYNEAFPKEEKIPIWLLKLLTRKNKANFYGIYNNEKFIGLIYNIYYKDIVFVFYLAIDEKTRGQGYGSKVLEFIKQIYKKHRIILCIEHMDKSSNNYEQRKKSIDTSRNIACVGQSSTWCTDSYSYTATEDCAILGEIGALDAGAAEIYINSVPVGFVSTYSSFSYSCINYYIKKGDNIQIKYCSSGKIYVSVYAYGLK